MPIFDIKYTTKEIVHEFRTASIEANTQEEAMRMVEDDPYEWDVEDSEYYNYDRDDFIVIDEVINRDDLNIAMNCPIRDIPYPGLKRYIEQYMLENNIRLDNILQLYWKTYDQYWKTVADGLYDMKFEKVKLRRI